MAAIVPLARKSVVVTVNGVTWRVTRGTIRVANEVIRFVTTGQTADADGNYWTNKLAGVNDWSVSGEGYLDYNANAALRGIGASHNMRPGTGAAGTFLITFAANFAVSGTVVVSEWSPSFNAEDSNKPCPFSVVKCGYLSPLRVVMTE